jgi:hypothetical protein
MTSLNKIRALNDSVSYLIEQIDKCSRDISTAKTSEIVQVYERQRAKYYESLMKCVTKMGELR